ncbi:MAG: hypothetical protein JWN48_5897 [Myxococcaceae bacterium]|nr:hypothetical protein [Myxococcaceae bacterium]
MEPTAPPFGLSRETTIRRSADGKWSQDGEAIDNPKLAHAFDCWIELAEDGRYCLKNDINWAYVTIEGAPFFVRSCLVSGQQAELLLSNDKRVTLDFTTLREGPDSALYCEAYPHMPARFDTHAAVQLGALLEEDEQGPYFLRGGVRIRPPRVQDPLAFEGSPELASTDAR